MRCRKCKEDKPESEYDKRFDGQPLYVCKGCMVIVRSEKKKKSYVREVAIMKAKGRELRRLTDAQVLEIKAKRAGGTDYGTLATEYGVSRTTVSKVVKFGYR